MKKSSVAKKEADELKQRLDEVNVIISKSEEEEMEKIKSIREKVTEICDAEGLFCGIILTKHDVLRLVEIAIDSKDNITIPFNIYFKE